MASTYTTNAGIELIGTGEQSGTWGETTNDNLQIIDRLTNGVGDILLSGTTHTLTTSDGALSDGQYSVLVFGGSPTGTNTVTISPNTNQHVYIVKNNSGYSVVLTQGSGGDVTVADGAGAIVYADGAGAGAAVVDVTSTFDFQPLDAGLTSIAGLTTSADKMIYTTASDTYAVTDLTAAGRAILDDADASAQRTTLGLGTIATQAADNVSITGGSVTGITDIAVADGGTGVSTVPTNGQLLIGNGSGYTVSTLTEGSGVSITNGSGSVTISATGSGGTVTSVSGTGTVNGITLSGTVTSSGNLTLGGTFSATVSQISDLTATAAEINKLDGLTATTAELNYLDITTLGSSQASKAVTADANGNVKLLEEVQAVCYLETVIGLSGTTPTVDCDEGNTFTLTTSGNTTFTFSYAGVQLTSNDAYAFTLRITSGGTHTLTWPASVDWAGGSAPDAPASGETDVYVFFTTDGGTNWYGFLAGDALA